MKQNKIPRNEYIRKPVGKTNPYKEDTIYTDMGQWKYPGQVTKIPSGDITMQGVPYPVYGQDNLGYSQMMYPGMDYQFPGQYVTEYPMAAYGGDPSLPNIEGHYPFGGQNTKTHTHMQAGGSWGTPEQMYNDSLNLWKAYQFQKANSGPGYEAWLKDIGKSFFSGPEGLRKIRERNLGPIGTMFKGKNYTKSNYKQDLSGYDPPYKEDQPIINYYKSLKFSGPTKIGMHASPDIWHKYINPIAEYNDGSLSPVYKKPVYNPSKGTPNTLPNKQEAATISADYLPMIQAGMPDMVSREPEIIASPTSRPSSTNNRISWRMDPETRKMVPVYLEGKTQKVKEGKRLYNKYIPSSTAAIPADFVPQFEPDGNKDVVSKQMGGWLDQYQDGGWDENFQRPGPVADNVAPVISTPFTPKISQEFLQQNVKPYSYNPLPIRTFEDFKGKRSTLAADYNDYLNYKTYIDRYKKSNLPEILQDAEDSYQRRGKWEESVRSNDFIQSDVSNWLKLSHLDEAYANKARENQYYIPSGKQIKLTQGRYNLGKIDTGLVDEIVKKAKQYGVDPLDILAIAGRESTFAQPYGKKSKRESNDLTDIFSAWANSKENASRYKDYFGKKKHPGLSLTKDKSGWWYREDYIDGRSQAKYSQEDVDEYLKYLQEKEKTGPKDNALDFVAKMIKDKKLHKYNPGDPDYQNKLANEKKLLSQEKELMKYLGSNNEESLTTKKMGGWLDAYDDEYRRGGQRRRRGTSKNIQSSINDIFRRNYDVFGPAGKPRFNPRARYEEGGYLKHYQGDVEGSQVMPDEAVPGVNYFSLPEVTVKPKTWLQKVQESDFIKQIVNRLDKSTGGKDWYKDPSKGIGSALAEVVSLPFAAPQLAATYGLTGKVQTPSEAMDIQNPYAAFITDAVLDPTNLVGAGLADDALKLSSKAGNLFKKSAKLIDTPKQLVKKNKNKLNGSFIKELIGEIKQGKANKASIKKGNEWLENWIKHPATQAKIDKDIEKEMALSKYYAKPEEQRALLETMRNQAKNFKPNTKEYSLTEQFLEALLGRDPIHNSNWGVSYMHAYPTDYRQKVLTGVYKKLPDKYGSWVSRSPLIDQKRRFSTTIHEGTHDWVPEDVFKQLKLRNISLANTNPQIKEDFLNWENLRAQGANPVDHMNRARAYQAYLADPTEMHARTMELRQELGLKPDDVVTPEYADQVIKWIDEGNSKVDPKFLKVIDKDPNKFAEMFNRFWGTVPATIGAGYALQEQKMGGWLDKYNNF